MTPRAATFSFIWLRLIRNSRLGVKRYRARLVPQYYGLDAVAHDIIQACTR